METDVNSQRSVIEESKSRITMLENILAKEAVFCHHLALYLRFKTDYNTILCRQFTADFCNVVDFLPL